MSDKIFYLTTPIYYVNATPHLGHAYTTILADTMARFQKLRLGPDRVYFLTGTDEHGDKIVQAAAQGGESPQAYVDRISGIFQATWTQLGLAPNQFIRTTSEPHKLAVQRFLQQIYDAGDIYFGEYGGHYCLGCERFYTEKELVEGKCPDHQTIPSFIKEQNYFFRMGKYQEWLIDHIHRHPDFIRPERFRNEVLSFLKEPLEDLCISRPAARLTWGIPLPFDDRYVTYVWFDALINYISALGWPDGDAFRRFWPAAQHMIAKDILKPHAIYWPTMLKAAGLPPYRHLNVHGYWKIEEAKMSKSRGSVVRPLDLADQYGIDAFRYFMLREMTFGLDAAFSEEALVARLNADLANDLGNLYSRVLKLIQRYYGGVINQLPDDGELAGAGRAAVADVIAAMERFAFSEALAAIWNLISATNKYLVANEPWKHDPADARTKAVLATAAETLRAIATLLLPFLPQSAERMLRGLGVPESTTPIRLEDAYPSPSRIESHEWRVHEVPSLFPRIQATAAKPPLRSSPSPSPSPPNGGEGLIIKASTPHPEGTRAARGTETTSSPQRGGEDRGEGGGENAEPITIEEFRRVDLRVAEVIAAEAIKGSRKLVKLRVRLNDEERTVVAGLKEHYPPETWAGKRIILVANLKPTSLMGVTSQGMVLAAEDDTGRIVLLTSETPVPSGAKIR
ncbi:methionyl-tRNA synthetase [Candidatus Methylomirabilis lanthanidiphila]|uniref:Methionine--tRNA ligase n=1 Tax=Candidatus Methylomirabilis lanthanidiphila TaxID=2211376 RepID=A0A564ZEY2_9BACT|nr:methionine--tRNA ligase [Candidatus Methylomirabilis lanthanidiphila]VUZ83814.1 methionyl-tRNA synthetase [Candidatus Methylomirabilis lanthanidiphila]